MSESKSKKPRHALSPADVLAKIEKNVVELNALAVLGFVNDGKEVNVDAVTNYTGRCLEGFGLGMYLQLLWLDSDIPIEVREELEKAWLKYNKQLQNLMVLVGPVLLGIQNKHTPLSMGGPQGLIKPPGDLRG